MQPRLDLAATRAGLDVSSTAAAAAAQKLLENLERVAAVASAPDLRASCSQLRVFLREVRDAVVFGDGRKLVIFSKGQSLFFSSRPLS